MRMFRRLRLFILAALTVVIVLSGFVIVHASNAPVPADSITSKDIIMILFGLLQTILLAIGVWLISNDRELFTRLRQVETKQEVRDNLCEERNTEGSEFHHHRASDKDPTLALKESVDTLRRLLHTFEKPDGQAAV
jgi:uncharacterized membrane protein YcjF (UPF0283 family)